MKKTKDLKTRSQKPIIELKDVWKSYQVGKVQLDVLRGINVQIFEGEFVAILGPSGSGKSTMMNQIGLLDTPSKGELLLNNKDVAEMDESDLAQLRGKTIGFIFQQFNLIPTLSALENVTLPTIFQNVSKVERIARGTKLLEMVGLADRMHHKPSELSGGQQQRVAIARSLVNEPTILLADEPTGNLDSVSGDQVVDIIFNLQKEGKTIVLITHDRRLAKKAQRIIYIKDGLVVKNPKL